ncbi:MAG: 16S rRNA (uracil(1498)-N(3))-methyltransferase, partial [Chloroflexi bacterium]|nr:16S rRNA (uracil(1498)-N(3))-methyltransferase [Chloroflexota bacterium]
MSVRFFAGESGLSAEQRRQVVTVLRLVPGAVITLVADGVERDVRLTRVALDAVEGDVVATRGAAAEPRASLVLAMPLLRGERSEEIVEAAAQLGVRRFVPFVSERSVVRELSTAKRERWRRIAREAAETARRGRIPAIDEPRPWPEALAALELPLVVAWEEHPHGDALEAAIPRGDRLSLVIGPEGGLTATEVDAARARGARVASLGRRVLRAETAAIAAVAR